ncbi:hypothetical protein N9383_00055 [Granulosicoccus sp.]|nr:hypothetical protein [Granulosicoccus sp.]
MKFLVTCTFLACAIQLLSSNVAAASASLTLGATDTNDYGFSFNGISDHRVSADFTLPAGIKTRQLSLKGYDIDYPSEVRVSINGRQIGNLVKGPNDGFETTHMLIPAAFLTTSINTLSFEQTTPGWRWGITDIEISDLPTLQPGTVDSGSYGYRYAGAVERIERADFRISAKPNKSTELNVIGYDIDFTNEVSVLLNDVSIGYLDKSSNDGYSNTVISIPESRYQSGENILSFEQAGIKWRWGVSDIEITEVAVVDQPSTELTLNKANEGKFGYSYDGILANPEEVTFTFNNPQSGPVDVLTLDIEGYDIDFQDEVSVFVNHTFVGTLSISPNDGSSRTTLPIQTTDQLPGTNTIGLVQKTEGWRWGVTDIKITAGCNYPLIYVN